MEKQWWGSVLWGRLEQPAALTAAQVGTNIVAAGAGVVAASGGFPHLLHGTVGPYIAVAIGAVLILGGLVGAAAVLRGLWWLERVALLTVGLGWVLMFPAAITYANDVFRGAPWLVLLLLLIALGDVFKRYRRIDWAYLDPTR